MGWSQHLFGVLRRALSKEVKEQVGTDRFENKYYYIPEYKNWRGQTIREKRIVEAANKREIDYEVGDIPTEWEAWIRKTRKTPPNFYEKEKLLQEESNKELPPPVQTQIKGHASAPYFGKEEPSVTPTSTGKTFQPGSWMRKTTSATVNECTVVKLYMYVTILTNKSKKLLCAFHLYTTSLCG
ncbi:hypothetical protein K5549_004681 [Capra hircus]|nr:hypothetical protein K5549_004681 [Capra hircus]